MVVISGGSVAAEWTLIASDDGFNTYVNKETIHKKGNTAKMWSMFDFKTFKATADGKHYLSSKTQQEHDCRGEQQRILVSRGYSGQMGSGSTIFSITNHGMDFKEPIISGSIGELLWETACEENK